MIDSISSQFIKKARSVHGSRYDYSLVEYKNSYTKIRMICKKHGWFDQVPKSHLGGCGCKLCGIEKQKQTMLEKYGVEYPSQSTEIQEKTKRTNLKKYGFECTLQSKEVREKSKRACFEKYGAEHPSQSKDIQTKTKQTNLKKYSVECTLQSKDAQEKKKRTWIEKYGVEHPSQKHYPPDTLDKLNSFKWLYKEYIEDSKTSYQIGDELCVDPTTICSYLRKHNIPLFHLAKYSKLAIQWLEAIMEREGIFIQHAGNIGEFNIPNTRLVVDGYCKETNTIYEFYGDRWHGNLSIFSPEDKCHPFNPEITALELNNRTLSRERRIKSLGYNLETTWEKMALLAAIL